MVMPSTFGISFAVSASAAESPHSIRIARNKTIILVITVFSFRVFRVRAGAFTIQTIMIPLFVQYCEDYSLQERITAITGDKRLRKKGEDGMRQLKGYQDNP